MRSCPAPPTYSFKTLTYCISYVRAGLTSNVPVTSAETWDSMVHFPDRAGELDFLMIHIHPYWDGQSITNAAQYVLSTYNTIAEDYPGKRIVIGKRDGRAEEPIPCPNPFQEYQVLQTRQDSYRI